MGGHQKSPSMDSRVSLNSSSHVRGGLTRQTSAGAWGDMPGGWGDAMSISPPKVPRGGLSTPAYYSDSRSTSATTPPSDLRLPTSWSMVKIHSERFFLNKRFLVAQREHPGADGANAHNRVSNQMLQRPRKGHPILYVLMPQALDIPDPFEACISVPPEKSGEEVKLIYLNTADLTTHATNPNYTGSKIMAQWEEMADDDGDKYWLNLNSGITTYDDPRMVTKPVVSKSLSVKHARKEGLHRTSTVKVTRKMPTWQISALNPAAFEQLDWCLTDERDIPSTVRNKTYNRYMDILPNPLTRVPLRMRGNDPSSAYIHANWVRGPNGNPKYYIGAQGPNKSTVNQFWRMIWQTKPSCIVMVTGLTEHGVDKCERYWPGLADGKTTLKFDRIVCMTVKCRPENGYVHSTIKAVGDSPDGRGRISHTFEHFWYNTWPDHGVPRKKGVPFYTDTTLSLIKAVHTASGKKRRAPIVVHCSAGIGRTGTYIALDHCLWNLASHNKCSLLDTIASIRQDRCALVQHLNQYKFIHAAIIDAAENMKKPFEVVKADGSRISQSALDDIKVDLVQEEKEEAQTRRDSIKSAHIDFSVFESRAVSEMNAELNLGVIEYEDSTYLYLDPNGLGMMQEAEAIQSGFPPGLLKLLDERGHGYITPASWKKFQQSQMLNNLMN